MRSTCFVSPALKDYKGRDDQLESKGREGKREIDEREEDFLEDDQLLNGGNDAEKVVGNGQLKLSAMKRTRMKRTRISERLTKRRDR